MVDNTESGRISLGFRWHWIGGYPLLTVIPMILEMVVLLLLQKSGDHQLRLVVNSIMYKVL